jgi:hypothetical protein
VRRRAAAALAALALAGPAAAAPEVSVAGFGGLVTRNTWEEVLQVAPIEFAGSGLVGIAGAAAWDLPLAGLELSAELQLVRYLGRQDNWEVNAVPAILRWRPGFAPRPVESLAFGLGISYASALPAVEIAREGSASREKWYWMLEAGFATGRADRDVILRLHHRSTGNGTIGGGGSTNAVVLGLRQSF